MNSRKKLFFILTAIFGMALSAFLPVTIWATQDNTYTAADSDGDSGTCNQSDTNVLTLIFIREYQAQADDPVTIITMTYTGESTTDLGTNVYLRDSVGTLLATDNDGSPYFFNGSWSEAEYRVHADIAAGATIGNHVDFSIAIGDITDFGDGNAVTEIVDIDSVTIVAVGNNAPILGYSANDVLGGAAQRTDGSGYVDIYFRVQDADGATDTSTFSVTSAQYQIGGGGYQDIGVSSVSFSPDGTFTPATDWTGEITTITWNSKSQIPSSNSSSVDFQFKVFDGDDACTNYGAITGFTVDNVTPTISTPVYFDPLPVSNAGNFTLKAVWTEFSAATPQFGYRLNGGSLVEAAGSAGNTSEKTWTVAIDGDDKFDAIRSTYTDLYGNACDSLSEDTNIFVKPLVPAAPTVDNPTVSTLDVTINKNGSETGVGLYYVIKATYNSTVEYVAANGSLGGTAVWQTTTTWGETVTVNGLTTGTTYWFCCAAGNPQDTPDFDSGNSSSTFGAYGSEDASGAAQNWDSRVVLPCTLVWAVPDLIPPAAISNLTALSALAGHGGRVQLKWTAPGDDGAGGGNVIGYKVKYATKYIAASDFYASWVSTYSQSWEIAGAGTEESHILTGFDEGTTYWFAIIAKDDVPYWSVWPGTSTNINALSYNVPSDSAPATITNLSALTGSSEGEVDLTWTAPGDDGTTGAITGGKYRIRYATIAAVDWTTASSGWNDFDDKYELEFDTDTSAPFEVHERTMTSLHAGVTYYFRIKIGDEKPNWPELSNSATAWAQVISDDTAPAAITTISASTYTLEGEVKLEWESPGDDDWSGTLPAGSSFTIQYATFTAVNWSTSSAQIIMDASGISTYTIVSTTTVFSKETTYYFRVWTNDEIPNYSDISYGATVWCRIAPSAITELSALALDNGSGDVQLTWIAPGDDGTSGSISDGQWKIRYSTISSVDWVTDSSEWSDLDNKYELLKDSSPTALGEYSEIITGLHGNVTYYFRIWTRDENTGANAPGNWSEISNASTATVVAFLGITVSTDIYHFGSIVVSSKVVAGTTVTVTNDGNITETYSLEVSSVTLTDGRYSYWKSTDTTAGNDRFVVYSIFHGVSVSTDNFQESGGSSDIITETPKESSNLVFTDDEGGGGDVQTGINVPKGEDRKLRFRLDVPTTVTTKAAEKITITITAGSP